MIAPQQQPTLHHRRVTLGGAGGGGRSGELASGVHLNRSWSSSLDLRERPLVAGRIGRGSGHGRRHRHCRWLSVPTLSRLSQLCHSLGVDPATQANQARRSRSSRRDSDDLRSSSATARPTVAPRSRGTGEPGEAATGCDAALPPAFATVRRDRGGWWRPAGDDLKRRRGSALQPLRVSLARSRHSARSVAAVALAPPAAPCAPECRSDGTMGVRVSGPPQRRRGGREERRDG